MDLHHLLLCRSPGALRSTPVNGHSRDRPACLKGATSRHRRWAYRIIVHPGEQQVARIETFVWIVTTFIIIMAATPLRALATPEASACGYLAGLIDKAPPSPLLLPRYPTVESGPLHGAAYLYDNAVAAIALVGCGERDKACRIGAAILWAIDNDRTWHDGRLRNAYAAGVVAHGPVKLPGWWDNTQNKWLEDRYQVGSDNGNMAWAMLALLSINDVSTGSRFRDGE